MNVLLSGGAGYIGSTLVEYLLDAGHEVTVVDNFMYDTTSLNHFCAHPKFDVHRVDVRVREQIAPFLKTADIMIPLASIVGAPACNRDPVAAKTINNDAIMMMFKELSREQVVLMPTTNSAYGSGNDNNFCDETTPLNPISTYALDKVEVEKALMDRENSISFRLATVFGMSPRLRLDLLVNDFTYRAYRDGAVVLFESHFKRNYIHVRDVCGAFMLGIEKLDSMCGEIFNVGLSTANLSKLELCQAIHKHVPNFTFVESNIGQDPDQRNYIVSNEKIEKAGFVAQHSLDAGIVELLKGFRMLRNFAHGNV